MTNIIADVAGQYKALIQLVGQLPKGDLVFLGDLVDRGPDSKRVLDFVIKNNYKCVLGNHEHMLLDHCRRGGFYNRDVWLWNGGGATLESFDTTRQLQNPIPNEYLDWIDKLPKYLEIDNCLISHAFPRPDRIDDQDIIKEMCEFGRNIWEKDETTIIWNRSQPVRRSSWRLQICGHNSQFGLRRWEDEQGTYAICLDDSRRKVLTGYVLETGEVFQQKYIP